jgi:hypothetical protein
MPVETSAIDYPSILVIDRSGSFGENAWSRDENGDFGDEMMRKKTEVGSAALCQASW